MSGPPPPWEAVKEEEQDYRAMLRANDSSPYLPIFAESQPEPAFTQQPETGSPELYLDVDEPFDSDEFVNSLIVDPMENNNGSDMQGFASWGESESKVQIPAAGSGESENKVRTTQDVGTGDWKTASDNSDSTVTLQELEKLILSEDIVDGVQNSVGDHRLVHLFDRVNPIVTDHGQLISSDDGSSNVVGYDQSFNQIDANHVHRLQGDFRNQTVNQFHVGNQIVFGNDQINSSDDGNPKVVGYDQSDNPFDSNQVHPLEGEFGDQTENLNAAGFDPDVNQNFAENQLLPSFPVFPRDCCYCQLAREIIHSDGVVVKKFSIHQFINYPHALLTSVISGDDGNAADTSPVVVPLESLEQLQNLITNYSQIQEEGGYQLVYDTGINEENNAGGFSSYQQPSFNTGSCNPAPLNQFEFGNQNHTPETDYVNISLPPLPSECNTCELVRQILHIGDGVTNRMEIHRSGNSQYHGICSSQYDTEGGPVYNYDHLPINGVGMIESVVNHYLLIQHQKGNELVHDSIENLPSVPSTASSEQITPARTPAQESSSKNRRNEVNPNSAAGRNQILRKLSRTSVAIQRERTAKMGLSELKEYMHLTLTEAANKLKVCPTVVKKVCRRNGIKRWPCRKIRAIERNIANVEQNMANPRNAGSMAELQRELERLRAEKELAYKPPPTPKGDRSRDDRGKGRGGDGGQDENDNAPTGPAL